MSIRSTSGNFLRNFKDNISSLLSSSKSRLDSIVGQAKTSLGNLFSGGFTGMSESGMETLVQEIDKYCQSIEAKIAEFNEKGDIEVALKGDVQVAAMDFVAAIKELLQAYVSTMRQEVSEAREAYQNFLAAGKQISQDVQSAASDIRSNAADIRLD